MASAIGIVGCGAIGRAIVRAGEAGDLGAPIAGVSSRTASKAREFLDALESPPPYLQLDELVERSSLLVETAGGHAVPSLAEAAFGAGKDLMVVSIGALLEHPEVIEQARELGRRLYAPSGAIAGLDGIKSACQGRVDRVEMVSRKPMAALEGAPYLVENEIRIDGLEEEQEVFFGSAREACRGFPSNLNVSAAVSLAGHRARPYDGAHRGRPGTEQELPRHHGGGGVRVAEGAHRKHSVGEPKDRQADSTVDHPVGAGRVRPGANRDLAHVSGASNCA